MSDTTINKSIGNAVVELENDALTTAYEDSLIRKDRSSKIEGQRSVLNFIVLPLIFLVATLLGGLRFGAADNALVFLKPPHRQLIY